MCVCLFPCRWCGFILCQPDQPPRKNARACVQAVNQCQANNSFWPNLLLDWMLLFFFGYPQTLCWYWYWYTYINSSLYNFCAEHYRDPYMCCTNRQNAILAFYSSTLSYSQNVNTHMRTGQPWSRQFAVFKY